MSDIGAVQTQVCDEKMKRLEDRIDKVEVIANEIHKLALAVERLTITVQNMVTEQETQKERLEAIEAKDGEMWRTLLKYLVTGVTGAFIGYILTNVGL